MTTRRHLDSDSPEQTPPVPPVPPMRRVIRPHREPTQPIHPPLPPAPVAPPNYDLAVIPTAHLSFDPPRPPAQPVVEARPPLPPEHLPGDYTNLRGYSEMNATEWQALRDLQKWTEAYEHVLRASPLPFRKRSPLADMTNELRMDHVSGLRKMARKMEALVRSKARLHDVHLDPERWGGV